MVERLTDLPQGVLGFRLTGKVTRDEYQDELMAPILESLDRGEKLHLFIDMPDDFHGLDAGALWEDMKAAGSVGLKERSSWARFAIVTDKDWVRQGVAVFGWISPGELKVFEPGDAPAARAWVAADA